MKRKLSLLLALILAFSFVLAACSSSDEGEGGEGEAAGGDQPETVNVKMATGGTTGTYYAFGGAVATVLQNNVAGLTVDVQSTGASAANINYVADGEVQIAIVQNDVMDYAYNGTDLFDGEKRTGFSSMAACYAEVCQVIASADSGIKTIADLAGKRVSVGDAGSGVEFNARQIMEAYGLTFDDIEKQNLSFGDSASAIKDGKIDAFFCTAGAPTTAVTELATTNDIVVVNVDGAEADALIAKYPFYTSYKIPADTYKGMTADATTVAVKATFIVADSLSEDLVYNMTKTLFDKKADIVAGHSKGTELDTTYAVEGVSVPFHPGAEKYFKEVGALS
ncbi:MAG: TAXI family TRAP transporter solute-binding subunit [Clostridia bacterium]|nr:TAXI family TRAP transporter solute-binding subunit [Clostridia bacterium]